jgi:hypothetical protein
MVEGLTPTGVKAFILLAIVNMLEYYHIHTQFVGTFIICLHTSFWIPNSSGSVINTVKLKASLKCLCGCHVVIYILQKGKKKIL